MTITALRLPVGPLAALVLISPAFGQDAKPKPDAEKTATAKDSPLAGEGRVRTFGLFGDPKRFNRLGGWGGMGAMMGQFGVTKAMLVMTPGVQKELKVTEKQKEELKVWSEKFRKQGEELAKKAGVMPGANGGNPEGGGQGGGGDNFASRALGMLNFMNGLSSFFREAEEAAGKILTKSQRARLNQIALQMEGLAALAKPELAEALNLSPQQFEAIQLVLNDARSGQMRHWMTQMQVVGAMRRRRPVEGEGDRDLAPESRREPSRTQARGKAAKAKGRADEKKAEPDPKDETKPTEPSDEDPEVARRKAEREAARARFQKIQQGSDQIQELAIVQINKLLTKKQRANFDRMLGEPFDPDALIPRPEAEAEKAKAEAAKAKPATPVATPAPKPGTTLREKRFGAASKPE